MQNHALVNVRLLSQYALCLQQMKQQMLTALLKFTRKQIGPQRKGIPKLTFYHRKCINITVKKTGLFFFTLHACGFTPVCFNIWIRKE